MLPNIWLTFTLEYTDAPPTHKGSYSLFVKVPLKSANEICPSLLGFKYLF